MYNNYIKAKFVSFLGKRCVCGTCFNKIIYDKRYCWGIKNLICKTSGQSKSKRSFPSVAWGLSYKDYSTYTTNLKRNLELESVSIVHPYLSLIDASEYIIKCPKCGNKIVKQISDICKNKT